MAHDSRKIASYFISSGGLLATRPVVVHFRDGRVQKGYVRGFSMETPIFEFMPIEQLVDEAFAEWTPVRTDDLKAIFFVRNLEGNSDRKDRIDAAREGLGTKVSVTFRDDETVVGYIPIPWNPTADGAFYLFPADPNSNNAVISVYPASVKKVEPLST
ncbi:MAG: hypothetical protein A2V83_00875 [Nitrospirae bacterium RBG_16_64_22]|nr:MAG: hypothetical protein A2V83_00875 [Nitrospirae bacterium RBG_16_64_22]